MRCSMDTFNDPMARGIDPQMDDLHNRMIRVTEDLRVIQRELNCAAMQAPSDRS